MNIDHTHHPDEYRIPERDCVSTPRLTIRNGTEVCFNRHVNRVGYEVDKYSVSKEEWEEIGLKIVAAKTGVDEDSVRKVIKTLNLYSPYKGLKGAIYKKVVQKPGGDRSMWFVNVEGKGIVVGRVRRWTGRYTPSFTHTDYNYEVDYEPATLDGHNQNLYLVRKYNSQVYYMVYPEDIHER